MFKKIKAFREKITKESDFSDIKNTSIRGILGGEVLNSTFAKKQAGIIILLVVLSFFYTGNRYYSEKQLAKINRLQRELTQVKYTYLTISSELMTLSRQSKVEQTIRERGINLEKSTVPPYSIQN